MASDREECLQFGMRLCSKELKSIRARAGRMTGQGGRRSVCEEGGG